MVESERRWSFVIMLGKRKIESQVLFSFLCPL